jgi:uncharacterized protein (TIGR02001 family)
MAGVSGDRERPFHADSHADPVPRRQQQTQDEKEMTRKADNFAQRAPTATDGGRPGILGNAEQAHLPSREFRKAGMRLAAGLLAIGLSILSTTVRAEEKTLEIPGAISGTVAFTNDYVFRGISQTSSDPSIQGSIEYALETGFHDTSVYAGLWGSNVKFTDASLEFDISAGVRGKARGFTYDAGAIFYRYPGAANSLNYDYGEAALRLGYDFGIAAIAAGVYYSPNYFADSGNATYYQAGFDVPLPFAITLGTRIGRQVIDRNDRFGSPDYTDWNIGLSREFLTLVWDFRYFDTNLNRAECADTSNCEGRFVLTATKKF